MSDEKVRPTVEAYSQGFADCLIAMRALPHLAMTILIAESSESMSLGVKLTTIATVGFVDQADGDPRVYHALPADQGILKTFEFAKKEGGS